MAAYSENKFDSFYYGDNRPGYPETLYDAFFEYHKGSSELVLDVGCGTGIATFPLLKYFKTVIGTDPSAKMLEAAKSIKDTLEEGKNHIDFKISAAEEITKLGVKADAIVAAECIHWLDREKFFEEAYHVLKPNGTLTIWCYVEPYFMDFPNANAIYEKYVYDDDRYMGACWQQPHKNVLRFFGKDIIIPSDKFCDVERFDYKPWENGQKTAYYLADDKYTMRAFRNQLYSWSAYFSWQQKYGKETGQNIADMFVDELKDKMGWTDETEVKVEWGTFYLFARKK